MTSLLARACGSRSPSSYAQFGIASSALRRKRRLVVVCKKANLCASRQQSIELPTYEDDRLSIGKFLSHPSGVEAMLNTRALQSFQSLCPNIYRCTLPKVQLLSFEATPIMDLEVAATDKDCKVEMLCCKFKGSEFVERQNNYFSASMTNHMTWGANGSGNVLEVDVKLSLTIKVFTQPFSTLPISAVEVPGNAVIQALVDRLVPLLLQQLLQDYEKWVQQQCQHL